MIDLLKMRIWMRFLDLIIQQPAALMRLFYGYIWEEVCFFSHFLFLSILPRRREGPSAAIKPQKTQNEGGFLHHTMPHVTNCTYHTTLLFGYIILFFFFSSVGYIMGELPVHLAILTSQPNRHCRGNKLRLLLCWYFNCIQRPRPRVQLLFLKSRSPPWRRCFI